MINGRSSAFSKPMRGFFLAVFIIGAALCALASSGNKKASSKSSSWPLLKEKASNLGHPALVIMNTTTCLLKVQLKGTTKRRFFVVPRGAFRTLVAAGAYKIHLVSDGDCRLGVETSFVVTLKKNTRYLLRLPPKDDP